MEYVWHPKDDSGLSGSVTVEIPNVKKQFEIIRSMSLKPKEGGLDLSDQLDVVEKQIDLSRDYVKSVKLEHSSGEKIKSFDELLFWKETRDLVLGEISSIIINGPSLGKH